VSGRLAIILEREKTKRDIDDDDGGGGEREYYAGPLRRGEMV